MPKKKKEYKIKLKTKLTAGILTLLLAVLVGPMLANVFATASDYFYDSANVSMNGVDDGTAYMYLRTTGGGTFYSMQGDFSISETNDGDNYIALQSLMAVGSNGSTSIVNFDADGFRRVLHTDSNYDGNVINANNPIMIAVYSVDKNTPAGDYVVSLSNVSVVGGTSGFDGERLPNMEGIIHVTRTDTSPSKLSQTIILRDGEGHDITGTTIDKYYGDESFVVTWEHTVGDGEVSYHPDDDEFSEHVARTAGDHIEIDNVGTVDICAWASETDDYAPAQACITVVVSKRPLDITGATIEDKTYDGTTTAVVTDVDFADRDLSDAEYEATATFDDADAGADKPVRVSVSLIGDAINHYVLNASNYNTTKTINKYLLHAGDMSIVGGSTQVYTPGGVEPDVLVSANTHGGTTTLGEDDYDLEYVDNTSVGSATIRVTGKGNYTTGDGPVILDFNIVARGFNDSNVTAPSSIVEGHILTADEISVNVDGVDLVQCANADDTNCDYTVVISGDNDGVIGSVINVAINGCNNYEGVGARDIQVVAKLPQNVSFGDVTDTVVNKNYGDAEFKYAATTDGDGTIYYHSTNESVATVDDSGNVTIKEIGDADIVATASESDTYAEGTARYTISVKKGEVTISDATVSGKVYDGTTVATVTDASLSVDSLKYNADFTATGAFSNANIGDKIVTVNFVLNSETFAHYCFAISSTECVDNAALITNARIEAFTLGADNATAVLTDTAFEYDGNAKEPTANVTVDLDGDGTKETTLTAGTDYSISYKNNVNAGTATATVDGEGNFSGALLALEFTISAFTLTADNSAAALANTAFEYDGNAKEPTANVTVDLDGDGTKETTLTAGTDYEITYSDNINAGTGTATITAKGNYAGSFTALEFTISKADSGEPEDTPSDLAGEVGQTLADLGDLPTGFAWVDPTTPITAGMNDYPATYVKDGDTANYTASDITLAVLGYTEEYEVTKGDGLEHIIGVDGAAEFEIDADYELFEEGGEVYVDNNLVEPANYDSWSSSTVISLSKEYMDSLALGEHTLAVLFNNGGVARASFMVSEPTPEPGAADTGVFTTGAAGGAIATGFSAFALGSLIGVAYWTRRRNNR